MLIKQCDRCKKITEKQYSGTIDLDAFNAKWVRFALFALCQECRDVLIGGLSSYVEATSNHANGIRDEKQIIVENEEAL